jgi:uncharacterized protein (TIGR01370 family)
LLPIRRFKGLFAALLCLSGCLPASKPPGPVEHWAAYYGASVPAKDFKNLDLVVFDRRYHPKFKSLQPDTIILAYVTVGEVYDDVPEKVLLEKDKLLLFQQDHWKSHGVDITSPRWRAMVMGYVDDAVAKGFDGVMLDTIDTPREWSEKNAPERADAMHAASVMLIDDIRARHPGIKIMLNRGLSIIPEVASKIDYVLAESILTQVNVSTGQFGVLSPTSYTQAVNNLRRATASAPHLQILTLDYWNQDDVHSLERIYATQRASGFVPYVTTVDLVHYTPELSLSPPPHAKG